VHRSPELYHLSCSTWTLERIRQQIPWLNGETGKKRVSISGVSKILKRLGVCFKRGRASVHSPDLQYDKKMAVIQHAHLLNIHDPKRFPMVYEDEMTYYRRPEVGKDWGTRGKRGAKGANQAAGTATASRIAGCIDVQTGKIIARQRSTFVVKEMYRFFYYIEQHYPEAEKIFVVLDNWPVHFHACVKENLARGAKKIVLLPLPTYAPWENPIEKVWLHLKKDVLVHHTLLKNWKQLKENVNTWFQPYQQGSQDLLYSVGLTKKMRRYRSIFLQIQEQGQTQALLEMTDLLAG